MCPFVPRLSWDVTRSAIKSTRGGSYEREIRNWRASAGAELWKTQTILQNEANMPEV